MHTCKFLFAAALISLVFAGCQSPQTKTAPSVPAISASAQTILDKTTAAAQIVNTNSPGKTSQTVVNSLSAASAIITAYKGFAMPGSSLQTGTPAVDSALQSLVAAGVPIRSSDVKKAQAALALAQLATQP